MKLLDRLRGTSSAPRAATYDTLLAAGYDDAQIYCRASTTPRTFTSAATDTPDGTPLVGLRYACDFRAEEEYGIGDLRKALTGDDKHNYRMVKGATTHVGVFTDANALVLSTRALPKAEFVWGEPLSDYGSDEYARWWEGSVDYARGADRSHLHWEKMPTLRALAVDLAISPIPRKKDDLIAALRAHPGMSPEHPDRWPGWFHYGREFVLRADSGVTADVLELVRRAAVDGHLAIGGGSRAFGSGMAFYDARDEGPLLQQERIEQARWYDAQMAALAPVERELKAQGFSWFFLGRPTTLDTGDGRSVIRYWLNGSTGPRVRRQPYGWYTLDELRALKFVDDANSRS